MPVLVSGSRYPNWTGSVLPPADKPDDEGNDKAPPCICCSVSCILQELALVQQRVLKLESILESSPDKGVVSNGKKYRRKNKRNGWNGNGKKPPIDIDVVD